MRIKYYLFFVPILLLLFNSCNSTNKDEIAEEQLTKKQQLQKLYTTIVKPMFVAYKNSDIPNNFTIDTKDNSINAGATQNFLEVSQGLVNSKKKYLQVYVLAHELSHIVTLNQAEIFGLKGAIPSGKKTNDYKKSEYLADLIAIHLMSTYLPEEMSLLHKDFNVLKVLLGKGDFMHPSGLERVKMMEIYINQSLKAPLPVVFKKRFKSIWQME